jgi:hypothetical protein
VQVGLVPRESEVAAELGVGRAIGQLRGLLDGKHVEVEVGLEVVDLEDEEVIQPTPLDGHLGVRRLAGCGEAVLHGGVGEQRERRRLGLGARGVRRHRATGGDGERGERGCGEPSRTL